MKKYLAVLDGFHLAEGTVEYAIALAKLENAHLVGVFLDERVYRSYDMYKVIMQAADVDRTIENLDKLDDLKREEAARRFQSACEKAGISFSIHHDRQVAEKIIREESVYADLLLIGKQESFSIVQQEIPSAFLQNLMAGSFCPVLVVPPVYSLIDKIFLLYDGKPSSVFATKMFHYLLPVLAASKAIEVLTVQLPGNSTHLPNNKLIREFIDRHFPKAGYSILTGNPADQIKGYVRNQAGNELLVTGAYRRTDLSRWFTSSMADMLLHDLTNPVFIAHH
ncbi:universal stress protein [Flavihumibacter sp. UBA7668]|uniref:universal stress protein n=1 Tax=Flavihumibacter sp. UBA7668 TaxID=1946542 RepID=UPI0025BFA4F9|nr:universal stress protein [Flavihumibacter sp. UBA7668]